MFNLPIVRKNRIDSIMQIDNLFDQLFKAPIKLGLTGWEALPAVDIYEKGDQITVRAEIPGVTPEQLEVSVDDGFLTISGEKNQEHEVKEKDYYRLEISYGKFVRVVRLPEAVKAEAAKANYKNGVLKIELTKAQETKKKQIKIDVN